MLSCNIRRVRRVRKMAEPFCRQCLPLLRSARLCLKYVQGNTAFGVAVYLQLEVVLSGSLKMKTQMLPDVDMCLRPLTRTVNLKILSDRFQDGPHIGIAKVHLKPVTTLLADIKSQ